MDSKLVTHPLAIVLGILVGWVAWHPPYQFAVIWILPLFWSRFTRGGRALMMASYAGSALLDVSHTVAIYFPGHSVVYGHLIWLATSAFVAAPWILAALTRRYTGLAWLLATLIEALPPWGAIGMASPLFAATAAFPGFGLYGLALTIILQSLLSSSASIEKRLIPISAIAIVILAANLISMSNPGNVSHPHWTGLSTKLGPEPASSRQWVNRQIRLKKKVEHQLAVMPHNSLLLTPEGIAGTWASLSPVVWSSVAHQARQLGDTVLLGATLPLPNGNRMDGLLALGKQHGLLVARQPLPLTEWSPGSKKNFPAHWFRFGPDFVGNKPVALAVCYEQLLVWPIAWSFLSAHQPSVLLAPANHGWSIPNAFETQDQRAAAHAWGRLYGVPVILADNTP